MAGWGGGWLAGLGGAGLGGAGRGGAGRGGAGLAVWGGAGRAGWRCGPDVFGRFRTCGAGLAVLGGAGLAGLGGAWLAVWVGAGRGGLCWLWGVGLCWLGGVGCAGCVGRGGAGRAGWAGRVWLVGYAGAVGWADVFGRVGWGARGFSVERSEDVRKTFGRRSGDVRETFGRRSGDVRKTFGRRPVWCGAERGGLCWGGAGWRGVARGGAGCAGAGLAVLARCGAGRGGAGWLAVWCGAGLCWRCGAGLAVLGRGGAGLAVLGRTCSERLSNVFRTSLERLPNVLRIGAGSVFIAGSGKVAKLSGKVVVAVLEGLVCAMRRAARPFELLLVLALISRVLLAQCACRESGGQAVPLDTLDGPVLEVRLGGVLREALRAKRAYFGLLVIFVFDVVDKVREGIDAAARRARSLSLSPLSLSSTDSLTCSACFHVGFRWWR